MQKYQHDKEIHNLNSNVKHVHNNIYKYVKKKCIQSAGEKVSETLR